MPDDVKKIVEEYSKEYCLLLEATYGSSMMSEGGSEAINRMFRKEGDLQGKVLLDIGFGLGGVDFYLAKERQANVFGVEINPWMVEEATRRTPFLLKNQVHFSEYHPDNCLPFSDGEFDIVFSKGVLTHLNNKDYLFKEVYRVLKKGGVFIIDDWLSPVEGQWGESLTKMCQKEKLTLYAETESNYQKILEGCGFGDINIRSENDNYYQYNMDIINRLHQEKEILSNKILNQDLILEFIEGYQLIADSIKMNELLIRWFRAVKA